MPTVHAQSAAIRTEIARLGSLYAGLLRARGIDPVNDRASTLLDEACDALDQAHADAVLPTHGGETAPGPVSAWHQPFGDPDRPSRSCDWRGVSMEGDSE